jgi:hypothetical protein
LIALPSCPVEDGPRTIGVAAPEQIFPDAVSPVGICTGEKEMGRGILLWLLGVPIPIIILILLFWH